VTVAPDPVKLAAGKSIDITVKITRMAGYTAKVPLAVLGLPNGVTATTPDIAENQTEVKITLKADPKATLGETEIVILGKTVFEEARQAPHSTLPLTLTVTP